MSELRKDPVSGEWIIMAAGRAGRPHDFESSAKRSAPSAENCPFHDLRATGNWPPVLVLPSEEHWKIAVIPNKYPALDFKETCAVHRKMGPHETMDGRGHHEIVITADHHKNFPSLDKKDAEEVLKVFQKRYRALDQDPCVEYVSLFQAWGPNAGASIYHPHYQIMALPIIPPDIRRSVEGSEKHYRIHGKCIHCSILKYDLDEGTRVIEENVSFAAIAPYASRQPFEIRIIPKSHQSNFELEDAHSITHLAAILQKLLISIGRNLGDPDYNFFIHTAPLKDGGKYSHYHWHLEIVPKTSVLGGLEWGTGIIVNTMLPEAAAKVLRQ